MTDREKLIELLKYAPHIKEMNGITWVEAMAGWLVDNGVTVQHWNPLSEPTKEPGEYIVMIKDGANATTLLFDGVYWFEEDFGYETYYPVTHWMPLPEPPKEG